METITSVLRLLGFVLIGAAWLIPNHVPPWSSAYNESACMIGLLLLSASLGSRLLNGRPTHVAVILSAVAVVPVLQYLAGLLAFDGDAWIAALYITTFALAVAVGTLASSANSSLEDPNGDKRSLATGLAVTTLAAAALSAVIAILQISNESAFSAWMVETAPGDRAIGNLAQPNNLGTLFGLGAAGLLLLAEQQRVGRVAATLILLLLAVGAALTLSRTALFFGPIIYVITQAARRHGAAFRVAPRIVLAATLVQWSIAALWMYVGPHLNPTALSFGSRGVGTARMQGWTILLDSSRHAPWQGFGWLQVGAAELATVNDHPPVEELWLQAHNIFLDIVLWCGYPIGLGLGILIVTWLVTRLNRLASAEAALGFCGIAIVGFHALLELPHHYLYFLVPIGLWVGFVEAKTQISRSSPRGFVLVPLTLSIALFIAMAKDYPAVEEDFRLMRFETQGIGRLKAEKPAPDAPYLSSLTAFLRFARSTPHLEMSSTEIDDMEAITKRYPYGSSLLKLAIAFALNGREIEARDRLTSIRHLFDEGTYRRYRVELRAAIDDGRYPSLDRFERSLP